MALFRRNHSLQSISVRVGATPSPLTRPQRRQALNGRQCFLRVLPASTRPRALKMNASAPRPTGVSARVSIKGHAIAHARTDREGAAMTNPVRIVGAGPTTHCRAGAVAPPLTSSLPYAAATPNDIQAEASICRGAPAPCTSLLAFHDGAHAFVVPHLTGSHAVWRRLQG